MICITGLLTLLALSHAGGDHIKGGSSSIKGGSVAIPTRTVLLEAPQEAAAPSPYSFNINSGSAYGPKVTREETGDEEGKVRGSYTLSGLRGATRVVHYTADDSGFHANIKTSEPNIKTHSPANVQIESVPKTDYTAGKSPIQIFQEVTGILPVEQPNIPQSSTGFRRTGVNIVNKESAIVESVGQEVPQNVLSGISTLISGSQYTGKPREVIVYDDGRIEFLDEVSGNVGPLPITPAAQITPSVQQRVTPIARPSVARVPVTPAVRIPTPKAPSVSTQLPITTSVADELRFINRQLIQKQDQRGFSQTFGNVVKSEAEADKFVVREDQLKTLAELGGYVRPSVLSQIPTATGITGNQYEIPRREPISRPVSGQIPVPGNIFQSNVSPLPGSPIVNEDGTIVQSIGQELPQSVLTGISTLVSGSQYTGRPREVTVYDDGRIEFLDEISGNLGPLPIAPASQITPSVQQRVSPIARPSGAGVPIRPALRVPTPKTPSVSPQLPITSSVADELRFINRQLIQKQDQRGFSQTFGNVVKSEADANKFVVREDQLKTLAELGGYVGPKSNVQLTPVVVPRTKPVPRPVTPIRPVVDVKTQPLSPSISSSIPGVSGVNDELRFINRQLIQKQDQGGFTQTFGSVVKSEADANRFTVREDQLKVLSELGGYKPSAQITPAVAPRPKPITRPSVAKVPVRPAVRIPTPQVPIASAVSGLDEELRFINRQLIQKQEQRGFSQTFGNVVRSEQDVNKFVVREDQLKVLAELGGFDSRRPTIPREHDVVRETVPVSLGDVEVLYNQLGSPGRQPIRPVTPTQPKPIGYKPLSYGSRIPTSSTGIRPGSDVPLVARLTPARVSPQANVRTTSTRTATRTSSAIASVPQSPQQVIPKSNQQDDIISINRRLIEKQNQEGYQQAFRGIINTESGVSGVDISSGDLEDISKIIGYNSGQPVVPVPQEPTRYVSSQLRPKIPTQTLIRQPIATVASSSADIGQAKGANINFVPVEQRFSAGIPQIRVVGASKDVDQTQIKIEDGQSGIDEISQVKIVPIEASAYVPPLRFGSTQQIASSPGVRRIPDGQQILEQVLV